MEQAHFHSHLFSKFASLHFHSLKTECSFSFTFSHIESHQPKAPTSVISAIRMDIPRKCLLSPILALILLSFIVVVVLRPVQLLQFTTIAAPKRGHSVSLDHLRMKLSGENQLHAVVNSGEFRRNKFSDDRGSTVSSTVNFSLLLILFPLFRCITFRAFRKLILLR